MNTELCHIQNEIVQKHGLGGRIEVCNFLSKILLFLLEFLVLRTCDSVMYGVFKIFFPQIVCNDVCNVGELLNQGKFRFKRMWPICLLAG